MIHPLPSLDRTSPTFKADLDAFFLSLLPTFSVEVETARVAINAADSSTGDDATQAALSAAAAHASEVAAATYAGAAKWISGNVYPASVVVWSPISNRYYRRVATGGGTTDPSADATNWSPVSIAAVADGGTGATTAAGARTALAVPSLAGGGASGTWPISVSGSSSSSDALNPANNYTIKDRLNFTLFGSIYSKDFTWGMVYRPSADGTSGTHLWTNAAGSVVMYMTLSGVLNSPGGFAGSLTGNASTATTASNALALDASATITSAQAGNAIAALSATAIGCYVLAIQSTGSTYTNGATIAGSQLLLSSTTPSAGGSLPGTWMCQGHSPNGQATVWRRVS